MDCILFNNTFNELNIINEKNHLNLLNDCFSSNKLPALVNVNF